MITYTLAPQQRQTRVVMPTTLCGDASWRLRALPETKGGVSAHADVRGDVRTTATVDFAFPGTRVWRPPT